MNPFHDVIDRLHPDVPVSNITIANARFNPLFGTMLVSCCFYETETVTGRRWWGKKFTETVTHHRHYTATIARGQPWEFVGTDRQVPRGVYNELRKLGNELDALQKNGLTPDIFAENIGSAFGALDALAREKLFDLLLDLPTYGDELRSYVRRADRLDEKLRLKN
jgi:hypothetical protein